MLDFEILKKSLNKNHVLLPKINSEFFEWQSLINLFDDNVKMNRPIKDTGNLGFVIHDAEKIEKVKIVADEIQKLFPNNKISAHAYFSFLTGAGTFGKHNDNEDVLNWQVIGNTKWTIWDKETKEYILEPGDFIYVPKGMDHNTEVLMPRASVSFGLE